MKILGKQLVNTGLALGLFVSSLSFAQPLQRQGNDIAGDRTYQTAVPFLRIVNSARAVGMGGAVVTQVDGESGLYNPGALGVFQLDSRGAVNLPIATTWLPKLPSKREVSTFAASAGQAFVVADESAGVAPRVAVALGYSCLKLDYPDTPRGYPGTALAALRTDLEDKADLITVAVAFDYFARIGIGYTHKRIRSTLSEFGGTAKGNGYDLGALLQVPILEVAGIGSERAQGRGSITWFEFTPAFAYVEANRGEPLGYPDAVNSDVFPRFNRTGIALRMAANRGSAEYATLVAAHEVEIDKAGNWPDIKNSGLELGLMGALFIRAGNHDDRGGEIDISTMGFGVRASGLIRWLVETGKLKASSPWKRRFLNRVDLVFDMGWYDHNNDAAISDTKFYRLAVTI